MVKLRLAFCGNIVNLGFCTNGKTSALFWREIIQLSLIFCVEMVKLRLVLYGNGRCKIIFGEMVTFSIVFFVQMVMVRLIFVLFYKKNIGF